MKHPFTDEDINKTADRFASAMISRGAVELIARFLWASAVARGAVDGGNFEGSDFYTILKPGSIIKLQEEK